MVAASEPRYGKSRTHRRGKKAVHSIQEPDSPDDEATSFYSLRINTLDRPDRSDEAYVTLHVQHREPDVAGPFRLKVDTGSAGNTLPLRTYRQMFHDTPPAELLMAEPNTRLTSYSGDRIPCLGSISLGIRKRSESTHHFEKFYVVDVLSPAFRVFVPFIGDPLVFQHY